MDFSKMDKILEKKDFVIKDILDDKDLDLNKYDILDKIKEI